jgi:hypothetical protein
MGYEGVTEGAQELISESAEKFVAGNPQILVAKTGIELWSLLSEVR